MLPELVIPTPTPPTPIPNYKLPTNTDALLSWAFVDQHMSAAMFYWISTTRPDGRPHAVPVWGIWYGNRLYFEGSPLTRWAQNLAHNPHIAVHLPSAEQVVLIEGRVQVFNDDDLTAAEWALLDTTFRTKYAIDWGSPYMVVHPHAALAWDAPTLGRMTRWTFA